MKKRLIIVWAMALVLVTQGCVLTEDFAEEPGTQTNPVATPQEQVEQQAIGARWAGLFYDPRPSASDDMGLLAVATFEEDGQAQLMFDQNYTGSWEVNADLEIVFDIEQVEERQDTLNLDLQVGEELVFLPQLVERDEGQHLERIEAVFELASGGGGPVRTTIDLRRAADAELSLSDLDGDWRTEQEYSVQGVQVPYGLRIRATQRQARYGPIWDGGTFIETLTGRALVFPCGTQSCWGVYQVENTTEDPPGAVAGFGGHVDEDADELRIHMPVFLSNSIAAGIGTRQ